MPQSSTSRWSPFESNRSVRHHLLHHRSMSMYWSISLKRCSETTWCEISTSTPTVSSPCCLMRQCLSRYRKCTLFDVILWYNIHRIASITSHPSRPPIPSHPIPSNRRMQTATMDQTRSRLLYSLGCSVTAVLQEFPTCAVAWFGRGRE